MNLLPLLGKHLKDADIIEIFDRLEMEVLYNFDRLHEGQPDKYWAASLPNGIQFRFDAAQTLDTIFIYVMPDHGFTAFAQKDCDIPILTTEAEIQAFGEAQRAQVSQGRYDLLGVKRDWIRLAFSAYSIHFEFRKGSLAMITVSRNIQSRVRP